jgi:hypothetical protein
LVGFCRAFCPHSTCPTVLICHPHLAANVGLLSALTYVAYTRREMAWDRRIVAASVACTLALFGAEGWVESVHLIFSLLVLHLTH